MRRLAGPALAVAASGAGAAFVAARLAEHGRAAHDAVGGASIGWLVLAAVATVAGMAAVAIGWGRTLAALGTPVPPATALRTFFRGEIAKYVPGGLWAVVGRAEWAVRSGVPRRSAYAGVMLSLTAFYAAAVATAVVLVVVGADRAGAPLLALALLPLAALAMHPRVVAPVWRRLGLPVMTGATAATLLATYLPAWALIAAATSSAARAVGGPVDFRQVAFAAVASWIAGFAVAPAPAGLGVREAVFVATCGMPAGPAAATAVVARLLFVAADAAGVAASVAGRTNQREDGRPLTGTSPAR